MGIRAVVHPRWILLRVEDQRHRHHRGGRHHRRQHRHARAEAGCVAPNGQQHQPHQDRPDQVVLLLDRQRPIVCRDLDIRLREIGFGVRDLHPVIDEERGTEELGAQLHRKIAADRPHHRRRHNEDEQGQRGDTPQTPLPENPEAHALGKGDFPQQNRRDEEAGKHEEDVHAHESTRQEVAEKVVQHHGCHRDPSQPVETRDLTNSDVHFYSLRLELPPREISTTGGQHWSRRGGL